MVGTKSWRGRARVFKLSVGLLVIVACYAAASASATNAVQLNSPQLAQSPASLPQASLQPSKPQFAQSADIKALATVAAAQNVSTDAAQSLHPRVAQDPAGNVHVVWDSVDGTARVVRYAKGTWNGSGYAFAASSVLADVKGYGYSSPSVAVAPNGTVMVGWSQSDGLRVKSWSSGAGQPSGNAVLLGSGIQSSISADNASRFHIAWNGNYEVQYCQFENGGCSYRDAFSTNAANRPDVAADSNGGVHIGWDRGNGILYRNRPSGGGFGSIQTLDNGGNYPQIAADGQGNVHIVWSRDFNIQYCRRTLTSGCGNGHVTNVGNDIQPSVGATQDGNVVIAFAVSDKQAINADIFEQGAWSGARSLAGGAVSPDVSARSYSNRLSAVWSGNYEIQHAFIAVGNVPPPPSPSPTPAPEPVPPAYTGQFANTLFQQVWDRTDRAVRDGVLTTPRSWIWGPQPITGAAQEAYSDSPGGSRLVQYFDKSRMELNDPAKGVVTNGLLVEEMINGQVQIGNTAFRSSVPAEQAVAGDPIEANPTAPTYSSFRTVAFPANQAHAPNLVGQVVSAVLARDGSVNYLGNFYQYNVVLGSYDSTLGHNIPAIFNTFFQQQGLVYEGGYHNGQVIDPLFVVGLPLSEPYWAQVKVGGTIKDVLMQAFERRVVTYTPTNPAGFQVEMGNVGQHYLRWRYGQ